MNHIRSLFILSFLLAPSIAQASLTITEVMYDPKGADANREWIEVYNAGSDITVVGGLGNTWRLYEEAIGGTLNRRTFSFEDGVTSITIPSNEYAVIARNSIGFREDFPLYEGILLFATMSLTNNEGRRLSLHDVDGNQMSTSLLYVPLPEASGTGATLQLQKDGSWIAGLPTPGSENTNREFSLETEEETEKDIDDDFLNLESDWPFLEEKLFIDVGDNKRVFVNENIEFKVRAQFKNGQKLRARTALWAFGNGDGDRGEVVEYHYPGSGVYRVLARITHNGRLYQDALLVHVLDASEVELTTSDSKTVEIKNKSEYEVELSGWALRSGGDVKIFAPGTHLLPQSTIVVPFLHSPAELSLHDSGGEEVKTTSQRNDVLRPEYTYEDMLNRLRVLLDEARRMRS
jgi:hypothetical protein